MSGAPEGTPERAPAGDAARVSVFVAVPPARAWDVFTVETDLWWRQGPRFRIAGARRGVPRCAGESAPDGRDAP